MKYNSLSLASYSPLQQSLNKIIKLARLYLICPALVNKFCDIGINRQLCKHGNAQFLCGFVNFALAENADSFAAIGTFVITHIFNKTKHGHIHHLSHIIRFIDYHFNQILLLFGTIASVGVQNLMQNKVDMNDTRNVIIISVMLTMGLGGAVLSSGSFAISGIGLSAVVGVVLNLVLPKTKKEA